MFALRQTERYAQWFANLRDGQTRARINVRLRRLELGHLGDVAPVGEGVSELRIHFGPGWRIYFFQQGQTIIVLLGGGNKATQQRDIVTAQQDARRLGEQP